MKTPPAYLTDTYVSASVRALAGAYEAALLEMSAGTLGSLPDRHIRMAIMRAMLSEARSGGFDVERMKYAASGVTGSPPRASNHGSTRL